MCKPKELEDDEIIELLSDLVDEVVWRSSIVANLRNKIDDAIERLRIIEDDGALIEYYNENKVEDQT